MQISAVHFFAFLEFLPGFNISSIISIFVITTFFVTSADSGVIVLDIMASSGNINKSSVYRVIWAILLALITAQLLFSGGINALESLSVLLGLPLAIILILIAVNLHKQLKCYLRDEKGNSQL